MINFIQNYLSAQTCGEIVSHLKLSTIPEKPSSLPNELGDYAAPVPAWLAGVMVKLYSDGHFEELPDAITINEYLPKQSIEAHIDDVSYGPVVAVINILGTGTMEFAKGEEKQAYELSVGDLIVFSGEHREEWEHTILPVEAPRVSLVIRKQQ